MKKFFYSQKLAPYVFILPFVLTVIFFWAVPIANGVLLSFQDVLQDKWVGLDNYKRLLSDKIFLKALFNSTRYMIGTLVLLIPFPMLFATLLNSKLMKKPGFFKSIYFLPALTSVVVAGTIFRLMFGEMDTALANQILNFFGHSSIKWLKGEWTGYFALLLVACWRWTGVNILYFLAGLQNISTDLYEAASIDGAGKWRQFFSVTVPIITPVIFYNLVTQLCQAFQEFNGPYIITKGGPRNSTTLVSLLIYNSAFQQYDMGMASAMAWVLFVILMIFTIIAFLSQKYWVFYSDEEGK